MTDYKLELKIKNGKLAQAMKDFGHETAASLARASGISQQIIGEYLNLKKAPLGKWQEPTPVAQRLCDYFGLELRELFPEEVLLNPAQINKLESFVSSGQLLGISQSQTSPYQIIESKCMKEAVRACMKELTPREREVIERRFGFGDDDPEDLETVGDRFGVTRQRIRQIEAKAMQKMRNPDRAKKFGLTDYVN